MQGSIWEPSPQRAATSRMSRFMARAREHTGLALVDYAALHEWSIDAPATFWPLLWDFVDVKASRRWDSVLTPAAAMQDCQWFAGARLNFAENLLRRHDDHAAVVFRGENGERSSLTYSQLQAQVAALAHWLRHIGIDSGDRVAALMPNRPETIIGMLAAASVGAVWSSASPDFGVDGVLDRFGQIEPRVLIVCDGYFYNGKCIDIGRKVAEILDRLGTVEQVLLVPWLDPGVPAPSRDPMIHRWAEVIDAHLGQAPDFQQLPFDHPLYILFSSGTTGKPKCIVHGAGRMLLQHQKELVLHTDLGPDDVLFYFTTCGWMMWNWLASGLATGATLVLFDGSPFYPGPAVLWQLAEEERVSVFGTSAKYLQALEKSGLVPADDFALGPLRTLLSTGSPLLPESFDYCYRAIKADLQVASISGGTDICSCFALGNPLLPVRRGELQCRGLGLAVEVYDDAGQPVVGERGELVCTRPFPAMPLGFWNDPDGSRYRAAYFERFPNVWTHGDFAELTVHGSLIIHGRSDAVLNPGGVRIGTAELYRVVEAMDAVSEAIAVGQDWQGDQRILLFVVLQPGHELDEALHQAIRQRIGEQLTSRHVPAKIAAIDTIPRTRSGKIVELAVRDTIHGRPVRNREALANPEALDAIGDLQGLWEP